MAFRLMSKPKTTTIDLLNKLKIVHSSSVLSNNKNPFGRKLNQSSLSVNGKIDISNNVFSKIQSSTQPDINKTSFVRKSNQSSHNVNKKADISNNVFNKIPRQTSLNSNVLLGSENTTIFTKKNKVPKSVPKQDSVKKVATRPFSTNARFLSTPSDGDNPKFMVEICQRILSGKIKNIVIMAGAGISCPSGIPDFRSPGTGLYDNLKQYKIPYPEAIFDIDYFLSNPKPFYTLAKELFPSGQYRPNKVHYFFKLLQQKKVLRRIYTQNIDGLERLAGVSDANLVEAHGTFASASCVRCGKAYSAAHVKESIDKDEICHCSNCRGLVKPDIVFFGEDLPSRFNLHTTDFGEADLLLVMGTSLEVQPFANIVDSTKFNTPRILLNRKAVGVFRTKRRVNDNCILGEITDGIDTIVKALHWESCLENIMEIGEKERIKFLDIIVGNKPSTNRRNFHTMTKNKTYQPEAKYSDDDSSSNDSQQSDNSSSSFTSDTSS